MTDQQLAACTSTVLRFATGVHGAGIFFEFCVRAALLILLILLLLVLFIVVVIMGWPVAGQ